MKETGIRAIYLNTPPGNTMDDLWSAYEAGQPAFLFDKSLDALVSPFSMTDAELLQSVNHPAGALSFADRSTLLALNTIRSLDRSVLAGRQVMVSVGSSRGASGLMERSIDYLRIHGKVQAYSSPMTTLGNLASFISQSLAIDDMEIEHSMTCSTSSQALLNAVAWLSAGMAGVAIAGAVETPLTPHNLAQMKALKIYSFARENNDYPVRALDLQKSVPGLVLGEAAIFTVVEPYNENSILKIKAYGHATERQKHPVSVDVQGAGLQTSMRMALDMAGYDTVDAVICHATGTVGGDKAEVNAIDAVFRSRPLITSTKWLTGHTFGAAGMHSLLLAALMLDKQTFVHPPYLQKPHIQPATLRTVMINTLGFGGQAISLIVEK